MWRNQILLRRLRASARTCPLGWEVLMAGPQRQLAPWKALHLAGGYGQILYRMYYAAPGHGPRGTPVEFECVRGRTELTP